MTTLTLLCLLFQGELFVVIISWIIDIGSYGNKYVFYHTFQNTIQFWLELFLCWSLYHLWGDNCAIVLMCWNNIMNIYIELLMYWPKYDKWLRFAQDAWLLSQYYTLRHLPLQRHFSTSTHARMFHAAKTEILHLQPRPTLFQVQVKQIKISIEKIRCTQKN